MSKLFKIAIASMLMLAAVTVSAEARWRGHGWHGHVWYGYGWGGYRGYYGPGWGWPGPVYGPTYYIGPPSCDIIRVRVWRHGHWVIRRIRRCY